MSQGGSLTYTPPSRLGSKLKTLPPPQIKILGPPPPPVRQDPVSMYALDGASFVLPPRAGIETRSYVRPHAMRMQYQFVLNIK